MLTACKEGLPNPHLTCVSEILNALICHSNDYKLMNKELQKLQIEYKRETDEFETYYCNLSKPKGTPSAENLGKFAQRLATIDEINECFKSRIEELKKKREELVEVSRRCMIDLGKEKRKFKSFQEKTVDYLKLYIVKTDDMEAIRNCEKDICEMHKLFLKEVSYIKKCENELQPFFRAIDDGSEVFCNCCCFEQYEWIPKVKTLRVIDEISTELKKTMGPSLIKAFAQVQIQRPPDVRKFIAAYLMNLEHNEEIFKEKEELFGTFKC